LALTVITLAGLCLLLCFYMHLLDALVLGALFLVYGLSLMVPSQDRLEWRQRWQDAQADALLQRIDETQRALEAGLAPPAGRDIE